MGDRSAVENELRALMLASLAGDAAAYRRLLTELSAFLGRYFRRRLWGEASGHADDLVQETLIAVHKHRSTYDPNRPFTAWVAAIARYKLVDMLRRRRETAHVPLDDVAELLADERAADTSSGDLDVMLDTLPERTRGLIRSVKIEGRSVAETAAATGMSETAVKVAVHRGLKTLLNRFGGKP